MFLNYIKEFSVKRSIKKGLLNVTNETKSGTVKKVGLIIDETSFTDGELLINELLLNGILKENIKVVVYNDRLTKNNAATQTIFSLKDLNWNATFNNGLINDFINYEFDLLISFYNIEKAILMLVTQKSKAHFKVGFTSVEKKLNDLMIESSLKNYKVFTHELFKYLKILNKI